MELKRFGDLKEGDIIRGSQGQEIRIRKAYDEHIPETMFELELENGKTIKASGNHLWYIETKMDYDLHRSRRKDGRKLLKYLDSASIKTLVETAESDDEIETSLIDMVALVDGVGEKKYETAITRIAESIGHIAENSTVLEDLNTGEMLENITVRTYDARIFSQQVLSLMGKRMRKRYPLIVGRVVTTQDLVDYYSDAEIPVMNKIDS